MQKKRSADGCAKLPCRLMSNSHSPTQAKVACKPPCGGARKPLTPAQQAYFSALDIRALVLLPLVFGEQLIGLLSVRIAGNRQVDEADLEFARSLAQQATLALEMARLAAT